jgi:UDP-N-acetylmuramyl pentapeptide phosphotransferase/UDP-N-acetylglucosamine-1-phosphate transferase
MKIYIPIILIIITFILKYISINKNYLLSNTGDAHQYFINKSSVPLIGGLLILFSFIAIYFNENNFLFFLFLILLFLLGIISDINKIQSAKVRLFFQFFIILTYIVLADIKLSSTGVIILDDYNQNNIFNYLFVTICLLILINGSNFMDGLNGLCLGYYFLILLFVLFINIEKTMFSDHAILIIFGISLLILLLLNFFNQIFIGDNGSYILAMIFGFNLIDIFNNNDFISPFFIILLLWYPCFELLFSIIRKFNFGNSPLDPDTNHLHQLIFFVISKKYKLKKIISNNLASIILLTYNFIIFYFAYKNISHSQFQIILFTLSVIIYCFIYMKLLSLKKKLIKK